MPSDLDGSFYKQYDENSLEISIAEELQKKAYDYIHEQSNSESIFNFSDSSIVNIVCPEIPEKYRNKYSKKFSKDYLRRAKFADPDTLDLVTTHLARKFPHLSINDFTCSAPPKNLYSYDLICIGGPGWNTLTRDLIDIYNIPLQYGDYSEGKEDFYIKNTLTNKEYRTQYSSSGRIIKDIGIFAKLPQFGNESKSVYLINGIQTFGVLGTAHSFIDTNFREKNISIIERNVNETSDFYLLIFELSILESDVIPSIINEKLIFNYSIDKNEFYKKTSSN